jgi:hypothetical protein
VSTLRVGSLEAPGGTGTITVPTGNTISQTDTSWAAWTPTLTGWTIGNGTVVARYCVLSKTVFVQGSILWGSTTSASGNLALSLPVESKFSNPETFSAREYIGTARFSDVGTRAYPGNVVLVTSTTMGFMAMGTNNGISGTLYEWARVSNTVPFTWANTDCIYFQATYEGL